MNRTITNDYVCITLVLFESVFYFVIRYMGITSLRADDTVSKPIDDGTVTSTELIPSMLVNCEIVIDDREQRQVSYHFAVNLVKISFFHLWYCYVCIRVKNKNS